MQVMNKSELRALIRKAVREKLAEARLVQSIMEEEDREIMRILEEKFAVERDVEK